MSDIPGGDAELGAIHDEFAEAIAYTGAGFTAAPLTAVRSDVPADTFAGPGATARQVSFELRQSAFTAGVPAKGDTLEDGDGMTWTVIDLTRRNDVAAWSLIVEQAS